MTALWPASKAEVARLRTLVLNQAEINTQQTVAIEALVASLKQAQELIGNMATNALTTINLVKAHAETLQIHEQRLNACANLITNLENQK